MEFIGNFRQVLAKLTAERAFKPDGARNVIAGNAVDINLFTVERNAEPGRRAGVFFLFFCDDNA